MTPLTFENPSRVLAEEQDEYITLHVMDMPREDGLNDMVTVWDFDPGERAAIADGAGLQIAITGYVFQPMIPVVFYANEKREAVAVVSQTQAIWSWSQARKAAMADPNEETFTALSKAESVLDNLAKGV